MYSKENFENYNTEYIPRSIGMSQNEQTNNSNEECHQDL